MGREAFLDVMATAWDGATRGKANLLFSIFDAAGRGEIAHGRPRGKQSSVVACPSDDAGDAALAFLDEDAGTRPTAAKTIFRLRRERLRRRYATALAPLLVRAQYDWRGSDALVGVWAFLKEENPRRARVVTKPRGAFKMQFRYAQQRGACVSS